jgi:glycosyltransferase involved in cell wall biosynthesis
MDKNPLVSIVAICHKHAPYVIETLNSIKNQTYQNIEVIIINNVHDECEQIIQDWIKTSGISCTFIQNTSPLNISENTSLGLKSVNGAFFQIIACDDVLLRDKIAYQVAVFNENQDIALVAGNTQEIDANSKPLYKIISKVKEGKYFYFKEIFVEGYKINTPTVLIATDKARQVGGYHEEISVEDFQMWLKLSQKFPLYLSEKILVNRRFLPTSLSRDSNFLKINRIRALKLFKEDRLYPMAKRAFIRDHYFSKYLNHKISFYFFLKKTGLSGFTVLNLKKWILKKLQKN